MAKRGNSSKYGIRVRPSTHAKLSAIKGHRRWSYCDMVDIWADRELASIRAEQNKSLTIPTDPTHGPQGSSPSPSSGHHPATD